MVPRADVHKDIKRMRLNSGAGAGTAFMWGVSREDACQLDLSIGPNSDCAQAFSSRWTSHTQNMSNPSHPPLYSSGMLPRSTASMDLLCSLGRSTTHMAATSSPDLVMSSSSKILREGAAGSPGGPIMSSLSKTLSEGSWISHDSLCPDESKELPAAVELGLGLSTMPITSGADSVLTSIHPASINGTVASSVVHGENPSSGLSFMYQDGSSHAAYTAETSMIDEGSTSNGTHMVPFLRSQQSAMFTMMSDAQRFDSSFAMVSDSVVETDKSVSFKASSATTTSTSGASSGAGDRAAKLCRFTGCAKRARGATGLCISHGGGRRCQRPGCTKGAEGSTIFCKAHGGGRRCERLGCTKSAEGRTEFCIAHGGGSRCLYDGCTKAARGRTGFCIRHGGGKRCQKEGCTKSAEGYSALCIAHGGGKRCQYPNCSKGAQGNTLLCKGHGGGKRCIVEGCNKGAEGSTSLCKGHGGGKRCMFGGGGICSKCVHGGTSFCVAHGGGKRCAVPGCTKSARGRTDCCVKHGGGKRCKAENCGKSAQGSTDFCKAHGGGKRCTWSQEGSVSNGEAFMKNGWDSLELSCERYAKGKLGLCAEHSALVQDKRVHGVGAFKGTCASRTEEGSLCVAGGESAMEAHTTGYPSFLQERDSTHIHRWNPSAWDPGHKSYDVGVPMDFSMSKPASAQPSASSQLFGLSTMPWPAVGRQREHGVCASSSMEDDAVFNMSSLSLPEERVHGGNIMALLSGKAPE